MSDDDIKVTACGYCRTCREAYFDTSDLTCCDDAGHEVVWAETEQGAAATCIAIVADQDARAKLARDRAALLGAVRQIDAYLSQGDRRAADRVLFALQWAARHDTPGTAAAKIRQALGHEEVA